MDRSRRDGSRTRLGRVRRRRRNYPCKAGAIEMDAASARVTGD